MLEHAGGVEMISSPRVLVLCAIETGWDSVVKVVRDGANVVAVVGLDVEAYDRDRVSGIFDVERCSKEIGVPIVKVKDYSLRSDVDKAVISGLSFDVVWVAGWQRLVPEWLIDSSPLGVLGIHGSPDGISGGRGRSPQNWAILLGCVRFDIALFLIGKGVDDGPVISERSFYYNDFDDIETSYYKVSLAVSDMVSEVLRNPAKLESATSQQNRAFYFPQRLPEDGAVDWTLAADVISRHCRALTKPYPGLRSRVGEVELRIWRCQPFDDCMDGEVGQVSAVFSGGDFLVNCADGRLLVREWGTNKEGWLPVVGDVLESVLITDQISVIVNRHVAKHPDQPISTRVLRFFSNSDK